MLVRQTILVTHATVKEAMRKVISDCAENYPISFNYQFLRSYGDSQALKILNRRILRAGFAERSEDNQATCF